LTLANAHWAFTTGHASNYHPLTWLSHMADYQIFHDQPAGHHLTSVLWHAVNAALVFLAVFALTRAPARSLAVGALFALHPLRVESVAWISERKDLLSGFFFLLAVIQYRNFAKSTSEQESAGIAQKDGMRFGSTPYFLSLLFFTLGLLSKPMLVTAPLILLLLDFWPLNRWSREPAVIHRLIVEKLPFFALSSISSIVTFNVQKQGGAVSSLNSLSIAERISNALVSYVRYLGKTFWPADMTVLYPHPGHWPAWQLIASILILLFIFGLCFVFRNRLRWLLVGWLWFFIMLLPVIGLVQVGIQSMADRYTYLPSIGLIVIIVWTVSECSRLLPQRTAILSFASLMAFTTCSLLTRKQISYWHDSAALFRHASAVTSKNYLAYNNLGFYLSEKGDVEGAMENYQKALDINPQYEDALNNLGYALAGKKRNEEALGYYLRALRIRPEHVEVHNNLGNALSELGRIDEAIVHYRFVLGKDRHHANANNNLGIALAMKGNFDEAIEHFHEAIRTQPAYASAHSNLGNALAVQHKIEEAIGEYTEALRLKPDDSQAHNNLGNALTEKGRLDEAVHHYEESIRLAPANADTHFNLAMAYLRQGRRDVALPQLQEAVQLNPNYPQAKEQLRLLQQSP
jgi:tetratricopeptide (TPR) repeat protein